MKNHSQQPEVLTCQGEGESYQHGDVLLVWGEEHGKSSHNPSADINSHPRCKENRK